MTWIQAWTSNHALWTLWKHLSCYCLHNQLHFCLFGHWLSFIKFRDMLNNIDKEIKCVPLKMQNFRKIAKLRCRKICEPQNCKINFLRKISCNKIINNKISTAACTLLCRGYSIILVILPITRQKNLGSWFDSHMNMATHITKTCGSAFFYQA